MFATLFADAWIAYVWVVIFVIGIMGWCLMKAATSPVGKFAGKVLISSLFKR
jgi:hypothetical protein